MTIPTGRDLAIVVERLVRDGWIIDDSSAHRIGRDAAKYGYESLAGVRRSVFDTLVRPHLDKRAPRFTRAFVKK